MAESRETPLSDLLRECMDESARQPHSHHATAKLFLTLHAADAKLGAADRLSPWGHLAPKPVFDKIPPDSELHEIAMWMLRFDCLAEDLRDGHFRNLKAIATTVMLFLLFFELFAHLQHEAWIALISLGFLSMAGLVYRGFSARNHQMAFLSARAIAEILRIRFWTTAAGQNIDIHRAVNRRYKPVLREVIIGVDAAIRRTQGLPPTIIDQTLVEKAWFVAQRDWFEDRCGRQEQASLYWVVARETAFWCGLVFVALAWYITRTWKPNHEFFEPCITGAGICLAVAAMTEFYRERHGFEPTAQRYKHSGLIYEPREDDTWEEQVNDVGQQALQEVVDWYVTSIEREICVPKGG